MFRKAAGHSSLPDILAAAGQLFCSWKSAGSSSSTFSGGNDQERMEFARKGSSAFTKLRCLLPCYQPRKHMKSWNIISWTQKPPKAENICPRIYFRTLGQSCQEHTDPWVLRLTGLQWPNWPQRRLRSQSMSPEPFRSFPDPSLPLFWLWLLLLRSREGQKCLGREALFSSIPDPIRPLHTGPFFSLNSWVLHFLWAGKAKQLQRLPRGQFSVNPQVSLPSPAQDFLPFLSPADYLQRSPA